MAPAVKARPAAVRAVLRRMSVRMMAAPFDRGYADARGERRAARGKSERIAPAVGGLLGLRDVSTTRVGQSFRRPVGPRGAGSGGSAVGMPCSTTRTGPRFRRRGGADHGTHRTAATSRHELGHREADKTPMPPQSAAVPAAVGRRVSNGAGERCRADVVDDSRCPAGTNRDFFPRNPHALRPGTDGTAESSTTSARQRPEERFRAACPRARQQWAPQQPAVRGCVTRQAEPL